MSIKEIAASLNETANDPISFDARFQECAPRDETDIDAETLKQRDFKPTISPQPNRPGE